MAVCPKMIPSMPLSRALRTSLSSRSAAAPLRTVPRRFRQRQPAPVRASAGAAAQVASAGNPPAYGYVMASVAFTAAVMQWMVFKVREGSCGSCKPQHRNGAPAAQLLCMLCCLSCS